MERFAGISSPDIRSEIDFEDRMSREAFDLTALWAVAEPLAWATTTGIGLGLMLLRNARGKGGAGLSGSFAKGARWLFNLMPPDLRGVLGKKCDSVPSPKSKAPSPVTWQAYMRWVELVQARNPEPSVHKAPVGWPDAKRDTQREMGPSFKPLPRIKFSMMNPTAATKLAKWMDNLPGGVGHYKSYTWLAYMIGRVRFHEWKTSAAEDLWRCWLAAEMRDGANSLTSSKGNSGIMRHLVDQSDNPFEDFVEHFENWEHKIEKMMDKARQSYEKSLKTARRKWTKMPPEQRLKALAKADLNKKFAKVRDLLGIKDKKDQMAVVTALT